MNPSPLPDKERAPSLKRPFAVTTLFELVLMFTGLQALRLWGVLTSWDFLSSLPLSVSPVLLGLSAAFWVALGLPLAWGIWSARGWAPRATRWAGIAFVTVHWLDRLILQIKGPQSVNWPFDLLMSAMLLISVIAILALPKARVYFGEKP